MKKAACILVVVLMTLTLFACSAQKEAPAPAPANEAPAEAQAPAEETPAKSDKVYEVAFVPKDTTNDWFHVINSGGEAFMAENPSINWYMKGGNQADAAQQIEIIEDLIAAGVDALCVVPNDIPALENVLAKAQDAGILVICHEASTQQNCTADVEAFDNAQYGAAIMDSLAEAMGGEGQYIVMVGSLTNGSHNEWADGGIAHQLKAYPKMELIEERIEINDNVEVAYEKAKELVKTYPNLKGFFGTSAMALPACARAIGELGLVGQVSAAGMALPNNVNGYLKDGAIQSAVLWDPHNVGYAMASLALKILSGEEVADGMNLGVDGYENMTLVNGKVLLGAGWLTLTKDNVDNYDF